MSFSEIIVTGHKNPDTDAACSAVCYADFKNRVDPTNSYIGVVCGGLNPQTRFVFEEAGLPPPELMKDVHPRVQDIARNDGLTLEENEPILEAIREIDGNNVSVIPVFGSNRDFQGIIGIHEVASYFIKTNVGQKKQSYSFRVENLEKVIPGRFLKRGSLNDVQAPIMIGSMDYEQAISRMDSLVEDKPVLVVGNRVRILQHAIRAQFPVIVVTNVTGEFQLDADLSSFHGSIYLSESDTADTIRLLWLSAPVKHIMNPSPLVLQHDDLFDDAKKILLGSDLRGLPVLRDGAFAGVVTRRSFIEKPRRKLIMIDHNEAAQSIAGAHDADIREIIDHHRLAAEKTNAPIYVFSKPLGSSCTIVYQHYRMHGLVPDRAYAVLMLSGILSDTLHLKSPTATPEDRAAVEWLAALAGLDPSDYYRRMRQTMATLDALDADQTAQGDFKIYREMGTSVGIAQVEVVSLDGIEGAAERFHAALERTKRTHSLDWAMLLVTDVMTEDSVLVTTPFPQAEEELAYGRRAEGLYDLPGVVSRKKQLLPEVLRVIEAIRG